MQYITQNDSPTFKSSWVSKGLQAGNHFIWINASENQISYWSLRPTCQCIIGIITVIMIILTELCQIWCTTPRVQVIGPAFPVNQWESAFGENWPTTGRETIIWLAPIQMSIEFPDNSFNKNTIILKYEHELCGYKYSIIKLICDLWHLFSFKKPSRNWRTIEFFQLCHLFYL